jgi:hypothetical protein
VPFDKPPHGVATDHEKWRAPMSTAQVPTRRPGVVSFIGVVLYIQGFLAAVAAVAMVMWRNDILDYLDKEGSPISDGAFTGTIIAEAVLAVLLILVANGIMRGSSGTRLLVAIVEALSMASAIYILVAHHTGGLVYRAVFSLFVGIFILWALYGHDESDRYFETNG